MAATTRPAAPLGLLAQRGKSDLFQQWLDDCGSAEYAIFIKEAASPRLTYEDWSCSEYALGPYLYRLTLDTWDAISSSVSIIFSSTFSFFFRSGIIAYGACRMMMRTKWTNFPPQPLRRSQQQDPPPRALTPMEMPKYLLQMAIPQLTPWMASL
jgi:hypothetical protein